MKAKLIDAGIGAASGAVGQIIGMIGQKAQDRRQVKQQEKLQNLQIKGNKEMSEFEREQQMQMWKDTNFGAQKQELKKAGMNAGLLYGMGGAGGATVGGGAGAGVSGASAGDPNAGQSNMMGMAMMHAQMKNLEANTQKTTAEAKKIEGVDTAKTEADTELIKLESELKGKTMNDAVKIVYETAEKAFAEREIAWTNKEINYDTQEAQRRKIEEDAIGALLQNQATRQGMELTEAKMKEILEGIEQRWKSLEIDEKGLEVSEENMKRLTETMLWSAGIHATGNLINGIMDIRKLGMRGKQEGKNIKDKGYEQRKTDEFRSLLKNQ